MQLQEPLPSGKQGLRLTFSPIQGSTQRMTGLVAFAKDLILARSWMTFTGSSLAVATMPQFQKAAADTHHSRG